MLPNIENISTSEIEVLNSIGYKELYEIQQTTRLPSSALSEYFEHLYTYITNNPFETDSSCNICDIENDKGVKFLDCVFKCPTILTISNHTSDLINKTDTIARELTCIAERGIRYYDKVTTYKELYPLYRADNRPPESIIRANGFSIRSDKIVDFSQYDFETLKGGIETRYDTYFVSTSKSYAAAMYYAITRGIRYVYEIRSSSEKLIDFNQTIEELEIDYGFKGEYEVASIQCIPLYDIRACYDIKEGKVIHMNSTFRIFNEKSLSEFKKRKDKFELQTSPDFKEFTLKC